MSLAIALVSVATFSTVAYSGYQEFVVVITPQSGFRLGLQNSMNGTSYELQVNGTVPNRGLYPVEFEGLYSLTAQGALLTQASLSPVTIQSGETGNFSDTVTLNIFRISNVTELRSILLNGSAAKINSSATFRLGPFFALSVSNSSRLSVPALMGRFTVGRPKLTSSSSGQLFTIPISFSDESNYPFPYAMYAEVYRSASMVANTTILPGIASPGGANDLTLIGQTTSPVSQGTYDVVIHILLSSRNIPINVEVSVP